MALRVEPTDDPDRFKVSGRGELHLAVLIENMRREGYELAVSRPEVVLRRADDGSLQEPYELVTVDVEQNHQGGGDGGAGRARRRELRQMQPDGQGRVRPGFHRALARSDRFPHPAF